MGDLFPYAWLRAYSCDFPQKLRERKLTFLIVLKPHGEVTTFTLVKASLGDVSDQVTFSLLPALLHSGHICAKGLLAISAQHHLNPPNGRSLVLFPGPF